MTGQPQCPSCAQCAVLSCSFAQQQYCGFVDGATTVAVSAAAMSLQGTHEFGLVHWQQQQQQLVHNPLGPIVSSNAAWQGAQQTQRQQACHALQ